MINFLSKKVKVDHNVKEHGLHSDETRNVSWAASRGPITKFIE